MLHCTTILQHHAQFLMTHIHTHLDSHSPFSVPVIQSPIAHYSINFFHFYFGSLVALYMKLSIMPTTHMNMQNRDTRDNTEYPKKINNTKNIFTDTYRMAVFFLCFHCNKSHTKGLREWMRYLQERSKMKSGK